MSRTYIAHIISLIAAHSGRDMDRGRRAAAAVKVAGGSVMDAALAQIGTAFDSAAKNNAFKLRVLNWMRLGADHPAVRARFGRRAALFRDSTIDAAISRVERWHRAERQAFQIASAFGCGTRLSLDVLAELRLALRFVRRKLTDQQFRIIVAGVLGGQISFATA